MNDLARLEQAQPLLRELTAGQPYLRLLGADGSRCADVELDMESGDAGEIRVAILERTEAGRWAAAYAVRIDAATGSLVAFGSTVSTATAVLTGIKDDVVVQMAAALSALELDRR